LRRILGRTAKFQQLLQRLQQSSQKEL